MRRIFARLTKPSAPPLPRGAEFETHVYGNSAGTRNYKLYVPSGYHGQALPLVVMLHGCTQDPDDFAAGTRMNESAERALCLVVYPAQARGANRLKCWNWFRLNHQRRDRGEPSIIAGIIDQVCSTHCVDSSRIYVAGMSAGGAMAATMGIIYRDVFAAIGIHSGVPHALANDLNSAFRTMQGKESLPLNMAFSSNFGIPPVPTIVFHGDLDKTVHPANSERVLAQCAQPAPDQAVAIERRVTAQAEGPNGRGYTRTILRQPNGQSIAEHWLIHGAGHAWSGGSTAGSYTDPQGPSATQEMLRFFMEHSHAAPALRCAGCRPRLSD